MPSKDEKPKMADATTLRSFLVAKGMKNADAQSLVKTTWKDWKECAEALKEHLRKLPRKK